MLPIMLYIPLHTSCNLFVPKRTLILWLTIQLKLWNPGFGGIPFLSSNVAFANPELNVPSIAIYKDTYMYAHFIILLFLLFGIQLEVLNFGFGGIPFPGLTSSRLALIHIFIALWIFEIYYEVTINMLIASCLHELVHYDSCKRCQFSQFSYFIAEH